MREIKFKAYWHESKLMTSVDTIEFLQGGTRVSDGCMHTEWVGKSCELVEYTGLKDKNGVEIYEGDILEFEDTGEEGYEYLEGYDFTNRAAICYENGRFELENFVYEDGYVLESMSNECHEDFIIILNNSKVIGNRFENPELMEG